MIVLLHLAQRLQGMLSYHIRLQPIQPVNLSRDQLFIGLRDAFPLSLSINPGMTASWHYLST